MDENEPRYWLALKGSGVPSWSLPMSPAEMRNVVVHVGGPGEQTIWAVNPGNLPIESNYDVLIGYESEEAQLASQAIFVNGSGADILKEMRRVLNSQFIIRRAKK